MYLKWERDQGIDVRLMEFKVKLMPLVQRGDAVKVEVCGVVFAGRLR